MIANLKKQLAGLKNIMEELQKYIGSYFGIPYEDLEKVTALFYESELKKSEYFVKVDHYCDKFSFVQSGFIRVFANNKDKEVTQ